MELKKYKLGELLNVTRGASLSGKYYATHGEYIRLTCGNFDYINNCFKENTSKDNLYYVGQIKPEFIMKKGDIITPLTEQAIGLLGSTAMIPVSGKYIQSQDVAKIVCNEDLLYPKFAYYLIASPLVKNQLSGAAQQTKIRHTSPDKIKDCTVWIPNLDNQKRIGDLLYNIDRKIALNRTINQNLEALAKQLYDYWFVQYDFPNEEGKPYKSSGGSMVWNDVLKREVPEGWEVKPLNTWLEIKSGFAFKSESYQSSGSYKIITIKNVQENRLDTSGCDYISQLPDGIKDWCILRVDDRLISLTGNCGRLCIVTENDLLLNQRVGLLYCETNKKEFAYRLLCSTEFQTNCSNLAKGAAQANLSPVELCKQYSMLPPERVLSAFSSKLKPLIEHYTINEQQNAILTKQRDELLPLLMNGQVTIE